MRRTPSPSLGKVNTIINQMTRTGNLRSYNNLSITHEMIQRLSMEDELRSLKFVHVAGTKGKGSTCFATAQLLRHAGLKVGLFTSPHLVDVRERCTINLELIEAERFSRYFTDFQTLHDAAFDAAPWQADLKPDGSQGNLPQKSAFFRFMFLLSIRVFAAEAVDVVVCEVGVGGRIDSTNVIAPSVCGITALGMDHMELLGDTTRKIAGQKAGIIKPGVPVFTSPQRDHPETLDVIRDHAAEAKAPYAVVDETCFADANWEAVRSRGDHMVENARLALALSRTFRGVALDAAVTPGEMDAIAQSAYPGRSQILPRPVHGARICLDGAHTQESMRAAADWFFTHAAPAASSPVAAPATPQGDRATGGNASTTTSGRDDAVHIPDEAAGMARDTSVVFFSSRDARDLLQHFVPHAGRIRRLAFVRFDHDSCALPQVTVERQREIAAGWTRAVAECADDALRAAAEAVEVVVVEEPLRTSEDVVSAAIGAERSSSSSDAAGAAVPTTAAAGNGKAPLAAAAAAPPVPVLVTGSLYLIGVALDLLGPAAGLPKRDVAAAP